MPLTPDLWTVDEAIDGTVCVRPEEGLNGGCNVANCYGPDAKANAKAIAALPRLLGALEMIVNAYPSAVTWHDAAFLDTARAALAGAR